MGSLVQYFLSAACCPLTGVWKTDKSSVEADSWPSLKILEYIAKMEETWNQLDVNDPECRKRVVCELHRNERHLGQTVSKFIKVFGYTHYLSLLSVPEEMKEMLQELHA